MSETDQEPVVEGEFVVEPADRVRAYYRAIFGSWMLSAFVALSLLMGVWFLVTGVLLGGPTPSSPAQWWCPGTGLVLVVVFPLISYLQVRRRSSEDRRVRFRVSPASLEMAGAGHRHEIDWKNVVEWREQRDVFYVWLQRFSVVMIPKRAFALEDVPRVREMLRSRVKGRRRRGRTIALTAAITIVILMFIAIYKLVTDRPPDPTFDASDGVPLEARGESAR